MDQNEILIDLVLEQIKKDVSIGDYTAIVELILKIDNETLKQYLPEGVLK